MMLQAVQVYRLLRHYILLMLLVFPFVVWAQPNLPASEQQPTPIPDIVHDSINSQHTLFQVSLFNALQQGDYEGDYVINGLIGKGDFGIGAINNLEGELIVINGQFYLIPADGKAKKVAATAKIPYAMITFFKPTQKIILNNINNYQTLQQMLTAQLPNKNIPYAIRIDGDFDSVRVRSFHPQVKPYVPLNKASEKQAEYTLNNVEGSLVGFYFPTYLAQVNMPGYHFHFITKNRAAGGHALKLAFKTATVYLEPIDNLTIYLPHTPSFAKLQLSNNNNIFVKKN